MFILYKYHHLLDNFISHRDTTKSSIMSSSTPHTGAELWAASKFIGRECATINKDFFLCKKAHESPAECESASVLVSLCANKVIASLKSDFPTEYTAFQKCLDKNDCRFGDCRKTESALNACWNQKYKLGVVEQE